MNRYFKFGLPVAAILGALSWIGLSSTDGSVGVWQYSQE